MPAHIHRGIYYGANAAISLNHGNYNPSYSVEWNSNGGNGSNEIYTGRTGGVLLTTICHLITQLLSGEELLKVRNLQYSSIGMGGI